MIATRWASAAAASVIVSTLIAEAFIPQWEVRGPRLVRQAATVPRDSFAGSLVTMAQTRLRTRANSTQESLHLTIYAADATVPLLPWQNVSLHRSYEAVREKALKKETVLPVAELVASGRDAVLRVRHLDGSVSRSVISGRDPLILPRGSTVAEVLHLEFRATRELFDRAMGAKAGGVVRLHSPIVQLLTQSEEAACIYVRLRPWPTELGEHREISLSIAGSLGIASASILFRPDAWFADDNYPVPNPYLEWQQPPDLSGWARIPQVFCLIEKEQCRCSAR